MTSEPPRARPSDLQVEQAGGVVVVRLQRPQALNALTRALMQELTTLAHDLRRRTDVHAVVLSAVGAHFSAGMDLNEARALAAAEPGADAPTLLQQREALRAGPDLTDAWERIEAVTLAAIEGQCLGGGAALALACDFRIAGAQAQLRLPEVPLGMNMSWHSLPRLAALVGPARAKRIAILGEPVDAATMLAWGLADEVAAAGQAEAAARRWAERVAQLPPLPVRMTKEALNAAVVAQHQALAFADRDQFLLTAHSADLREGLAAFFAKRAPQYKGD